MYIFSMQLFWSMHHADQSHLIPVEWQKGSTYDGQTLLCVVGSFSHCWLPCGGCEVTKWNWTLQLWSPLLPPGPVKRTKPGCATRHSSTEGKGSLQCGRPPLRTHSWTWHEGDWPRGITSWEGMPRYSHSSAGSESLLGMKDWVMRGAESLSQKRKCCPVSCWCTEPP